MSVKMSDSILFNLPNHNQPNKTPKKFIQLLQNDIYKPLNLSSKTICSHENVVHYRCQYCKDCGIYLPQNAVRAFRESHYHQKLNLNPDKVLHFMIAAQKQNNRYDPNSICLKERKILVNWICEVGEEFQYSTDTIYMAVSYLDCVLIQFEIPKDHLQLAALVCIYIAGKFNENDCKTVHINEIYQFAGGTYSVKLLEQTEILICETLEWNLRSVTPIQFLELFLMRGVVFSKDRSALHVIDDDRFLRKIRKYAEFFADLALQEYAFNRYDPHLIACACIVASRKVLAVVPIWNRHLGEITATTWPVIEDCFVELMQVYENIFLEPVVEVSENKYNPTRDSSNSMNDMVVQDMLQIEKGGLLFSKNQQMFLEGGEMAAAREDPCLLYDIPSNFPDSVSVTQGDCTLTNSSRQEMSLDWSGQHMNLNNIIEASLQKQIVARNSLGQDQSCNSNELCRYNQLLSSKKMHIEEKPVDSLSKSRFQYSLPNFLRNSLF